jgi:ferrous-iron efflux pump FieF
MMYENEEAALGHSGSDPGWALFSARFSVTVVCGLILAKGIVYSLSGSVALLGTLIDSAGDLVISLMTMLAIQLAAKPADEDHRFGHGKAEGLAAFFQGGCLAGAAVFLALESLRRLFDPQPVDHQLLGVAVAGLTIILSLVIVQVQKRALARVSSLALAADQKNYTGDILMNAGVMIALLVNYFGGPLWVDTVLGLVIAVYIARSGWEIGIEAADMLMDKELPDDVRLEITRIVEAHEGVFGMHDLRTRRHGSHIHISFDIEVEPEITLRAAHEITRELEGRLLEKFPEAEIIIHKDPRGDIYDARHRVQGVHH